MSKAVYFKYLRRESLKPVVFDLMMCARVSVHTYSTSQLQIPLILPSHLPLDLECATPHLRNPTDPSDTSSVQIWYDVGVHIISVQFKVRARSGSLGGWGNDIIMSNEYIKGSWEDPGTAHLVYKLYIENCFISNLTSSRAAPMKEPLSCHYLGMMSPFQCLFLGSQRVVGVEEAVRPERRHGRTK